MELSFNNLIPVLQQAGAAILKVYNDTELVQVDYKSDDSPVTKADTAANEIIVDFLQANFPYPIVSEEGKEIPYSERKNYETFWLVDPLDGTKEFIKKNGEFTVNIALVKNGSPIFGAIYVPVSDVYYFGDVAKGAFKKEGNGELQALKVRDKSDNWTAVGSKSHAQPGEVTFYKKIGVNEVFTIGSSLKFCLIAEGKADVYFRSGPTMEWDTAAGHAIVKAAGGEMYQDVNCQEIFTYNKENLRNGAFLCSSNRKFAE